MFVYAELTYSTRQTSIFYNINSSSQDHKGQTCRLVTGGMIKTLIPSFCFLQPSRDIKLLSLTLTWDLLAFFLPYCFLYFYDHCVQGQFGDDVPCQTLFIYCCGVFMLTYEYLVQTFRIFNGELFLAVHLFVLIKYNQHISNLHKAAI